jgi:hypothetical protein
MTMSVVTSVPAFLLKASFGSRIAPSKSVRVERYSRSVESSLSIVPRDVTNITSPPGRTFSRDAAKK